MEVAVVDPTLTHAVTDSSNLSKEISIFEADSCPKLSTLTWISKAWFGSGISGFVITEPDLNLSIGEIGRSSTKKSNE